MFLSFEKLRFTGQYLVRLMIPERTHCRCTNPGAEHLHIFGQRILILRTKLSVYATY
jgi:hypothetical protein